MDTPRKFHAVVRPMAKEWDDNPRSLFFEVQPPIEVADPIGTGDVISNTLYDTPGLVRITPVVGKTDEISTTGYLLRGYRPEIGDTGLFGAGDRATEQASVESALSQLVGNDTCTVEFVALPITV